MHSWLIWSKTQGVGSLQGGVAVKRGKKEGERNGGRELEREKEGGREKAVE